MGRECTRWLLTAALLAGSPWAWADTYTCTTSAGKPYLRDRPITECSDVRQAIRGADGSIKGYVEPSLSPIEAAAAAACAREDEARRQRAGEAMRRNRNLMIRYPNEQVHAKARATALEDTRKSIAQSEKRLAELAGERTPLSSEAEFYVGRQMPLKLKQAIDANDAATAAQRAGVANLQADLVRVNASFDAELARLKRMWSGTPPGAMDPVEPPSAECRKAAR